MDTNYTNSYSAMWWLPESTRKFLEEQSKLPQEVQRERYVKLCAKHGISLLSFPVIFDENDNPVRCPFCIGIGI